MGTTKIKIPNGDQAKNLKGKTNWERLKNMTDDEIHRAALSDPDAKPLTDYELNKLRPFKFVKHKFTP